MVQIPQEEVFKPNMRLCRKAKGRRGEEGRGGKGRGGRAGHQKREAAPAPAYLAPPAAVGAQRGGRREETEAELAPG